MQILFKIQPYCFVLYLLLIGVSLGAMLSSGAFSAPAIFRASSIVPELNINVFQSGILMTSIFVKLNILLNALAFFILIYEILALRVNGAKVAPLLGFISVILIFLFTMYYTPYILEAQKLGEDGIASVAFDAMHTQSVYTFKALMISLCLLFVVRILKVSSGCKDK
ncbi:DUF4149 domain-containing protein [Helicobacter turcicus]|uniref:DUF4149 domain-containing protein n=1 Tax=Helicobacter turcicus TaxID=2867412 RepID=A0ABS7JLD6_9HELI|nr:DUF4149 domain-containing protein [Helicobacter turcicus]MBX7490214.1 DUF4149 domain-containing protein [Helicobacter turcicus]MBX7545207.1 DUF4149 domain-containing protein [Helicobacter turcicus]